MYDDDDLNSAVSAGALSEADAAAFRAHVAGLRSAPAVDEEHFRLLSGFNDIFVVIACALLLTATSWLGASLSHAAGAFATAATAWGLAEFFTRRRRMALPSILLLLAFVGGCFAGVAYSTAVDSDQSLEGFTLASGIGALAAWLHWRRFRVPVTVAIGTAAALLLVLAQLIRWLPEHSKAFASLIVLGGGLAVFALAMYWDARDPERRDYRSDAAFWLHLLAAPLLVHPVFSALQVFEGGIGTAQALAMLAAYLALALVSLAIDRRALMVSALAYVLYGFSALLKQFGVVGQGFALTALAIGALLLLLSAFWQPCRRAVLLRLPPSLRRHLPPLRAD